MQASFSQSEEVFYRNHITKRFVGSLVVLFLVQQCNRIPAYASLVHVQGALSKRTCVNWQTRQSLHCSHIQIIDVDEDSGKHLDLHEALDTSVCGLRICDTFKNGEILRATQKSALLSGVMI